MDCIKPISFFLYLPDEYSHELHKEAINKASVIGENTLCAVKNFWNYQSYNSYLIILDLLAQANIYSEPQLEAACRRALFYQMGSFTDYQDDSYQQVRNIAFRY
jgi:hypothetical protein